MKPAGIFWGLLVVGLISVAVLSIGANSVQASTGFAFETRVITPTVKFSPIATPTHIVDGLSSEANVGPDLTVTMSITIYVPLTTKGLAADVSPTLTPTPAASPTPLPEGVHLLTNHTAYEDSVDYLHIVGEVFNNTESDLPYVRVTAHILDSELHRAADAFAYTYLDPLPAGERTCFHISLKAPDNWMLYSLDVERPEYSAGAGRLPSLLLVEHNGSYDPDFGWYEITGQVRNEEWTSVEYVAPVGTLYDTEGDVVGCKFTYADAISLEPGETSTFEMIYVGRDHIDVQSYRIQVDGVAADRRAR